MTHEQMTNAEYAERYLQNLDGITLRESDYAHMTATVAVAHATLAIAEQLRIANLIAVINANLDVSLKPEILRLLGIDEPYESRYPY